MRTRSFKIMALALAVSMLVPSIAIARVPEEPAAERLLEPAAQPPDPAAKEAPRASLQATTKVEPARQPVEKAVVDPELVLQKLHPDLRELARTAGPALPEGVGPSAAMSLLPVRVQGVSLLAQGREAAVSVDLSAYFVEGRFFAQPAMGKGASQTQVFFGEILPANLLKVAAIGEVQAIYPITIERAEYEVYPADDPRPEVVFGPEDWAKLRENAAELRGADIPWDKAKAFGDGRERVLPYDWFEVTLEGPHKAEAAWARGYRGEGVAVSVIDDGVDFGHPDLMGTHKIYSSTEASQYNGWPMIMDPFTMRAYFYDLFFGETYVSDGFPGVTYFDTSATPALAPCGTGVSCFEYTPLIGYGAPGLQHNYVISSSMSQSGVVHVGTHHDESLRDYVWGERVAVLVADPNTAGVYDTVYVDLDDDYDFRDEKPLTKADVNDPATYNDMVAYRDMNGDGLADLSGGLLYFIADGVNYVPAMDWLFYPAYFGIAPPGNGDLIAMHGPWDSGYSHGTTCASNVVAQGVVNGMLPEFRDLPGTGVPAAAVYGAAPEADLVAMNNGWYFTGYVNAADAYFLAAIGYDAIDQTGYHFFYGPGYTDTDTILATSNSYGWSGDFNDGWDYFGQVIVELQHNWAPYLQFLFSTGNGGPGYGTVAPPSPGLGIAVGASTEYGSTGWGTITDTNQIMFNDIAAFSNSGPGARDGAGVDVVGGGAFAAGSEQLNYYSPGMYGVLDGNLSWDDWGGTSRSAPVVLGNLALVYQAYRDNNGVWPTHEEAKAILMSSATDLNYDVFKQGAGSVNADRGTAVAGGHYGVYMGADSATWEPGDYRGVDYPLFAHIVYPGGTYAKTFTVVNDSASDIDVEISDTYLERIGSEEFTYIVTAQMVADESAYGAANRDNFYKAFNYMIPITAAAGFEGASPDWYNIAIPADTDLMVVRQLFPFDEFDANGDYSWDNRFYLVVYNWKDVNGDGDVWDDIDGNGVVNFINATTPSGLKASPELEWDDARTELDRWEYGRFGYNRPYANGNELMVHDPLDRMHDGLFIGLRHHPGSSYTGDTHISFRIEFYQKSDVPWMETDVGSMTVPAGESATFDGTINVPVDMPPGDYQAAIEVYDAGDPSYDENTAVIPVALNVAADFEGGELTLGGVEAYAYDQDMQYNNGAVRGYFDWGWREESADWRFFYMDIDNRPVETEVFPTEGFDSGIPGTWTVVDNVGNSGADILAGLVWQGGSVCGYTNETGGSGDFADANSDCYGTVAYDTELQTPVIDLSTAGTPVLEFKSAYENFAGYDSARVWASGDGGGNWDLLLEWNSDQPGPQTIQLPLTAYAGSSNVVISFQYDSNGTSGWYWYWQVDDVRVFDGVFPFPPDAHMLVRDQWDDAAPHTDIDTVVLGPTASPMSYVEFGAWAGNFTDPGYYGPYVLDTVASSTVDRSGRSTWRFNTSSGTNEEWVMFPIEDGLHEILQHNVLFEGDQFDVVFTKTVGLLTESVHDLAIETYLDAGEVGTVTLQSSLALNGLEAMGYLSAVDRDEWVDEPVPFVSSTTIEWVDVFAVADGVSIELWTSSSDIPDIDLYLFYHDGVSWVQRGASTGADANEHILLVNPEDGLWLVGINNWSGPEGHFNMTREVLSRVPGITVTGVPSGAVPADTPVTLTILYDYPMTPGETYPGVVVVGPPEAPELKQIPIEITRLPESAMIAKEVDYETAFPGMELNYTIDLYNLSDPDAYFEFSDPIPDNTEFVTVTGGCCADVVYLSEDFEGSWPPVGWTVVVNSGAGWNTNAYWGNSNRTPPYGGGLSADADPDAYGTGLDTELWSPPIDLTGATAPLVSFGSNFQDMAGDGDAWLDISTDGGTTWTNLYYQNTDDPSMTSGVLREFDLSAYVGQTIILRWHYYAIGWAWWWQIDDVRISGEVCGGAVYDEPNDQVVFTGTVPLADSMMVGEEGFEEGVMPPTGWAVESLSSSVRKWIVLDAVTYPDFVHSGMYAAWVNYDGAASQDEWLYSPEFEVTADDNEASFWAVSDTLFPGATMTVYATDAGGTFSDTLWDLIADETWSTFEYRQVLLDLSAYEADTIRLAWRYHGFDGESFGLDDIVLPGGELVWVPSCTIDLTVLITDTVPAGTWITNIGTLVANHFEMTEAEAPVSASALTHIGLEDFITSYKEATEEALPGDIIAYQVHVINTGDKLAAITFTDPIPADTTLYDYYDSVPYQHFTYNAAEDRMEWEGNIAPGEEWVFSFEVQVDDPGPWWTTITNTATIAWDGETMDLSATTVIPPYQVFLPIHFQLREGPLP